MPVPGLDDETVAARQRLFCSASAGVAKGRTIRADVTAEKFFNAAG
jgi:hypothetical protein